MSFFIAWNDVVAPALEKIIVDFSSKVIKNTGDTALDEADEQSSLLSFIGETKLEQVCLGSIEPSVTLVNISPVDPMFYSALSEAQLSAAEDHFDVFSDGDSLAQEFSWSRASLGTNSEKLSVESDDTSGKFDRRNDFQFHFLVSYNGKTPGCGDGITVALSTNLILRQFGTEFLALPLHLVLTDLVFEAEVVVAFLAQQKLVCVTLLEITGPVDADVVEGAVEDLQSDTRSCPILRNVTINSEVGNSQRKVLKNVAKVEKFLMDQAHKYLSDELVWPNFKAFDLQEKQASESKTPPQPVFSHVSGIDSLSEMAPDLGQGNLSSRGSANDLWNVE